MTQFSSSVHSPLYSQTRRTKIVLATALVVNPDAKHAACSSSTPHALYENCRILPSLFHDCNSSKANAVIVSILISVTRSLSIAVEHTGYS